MKITLTYHEGRSVLSRLPDWMTEDLRAMRKNSWNKSHVYLMAPVGWKFILDELRAGAYGPQGGYAGPPSLYTAIAKITDTVRAWELHPAFDEGKAVVGVTGEVVPGFLEPRPGTRSPYPPGEFVLFAPHHILDRGRKLTMWRPVDWVSGEDPLCREDFHTRVFVEILRHRAEL